MYFVDLLIHYIAEYNFVFVHSSCLELRCCSILLFKPFIMQNFSVAATVKTLSKKGQIKPWGYAG